MVQREIKILVCVWLYIQASFWRMKYCCCTLVYSGNVVSSTFISISIRMVISVVEDEPVPMFERAVLGALLHCIVFKMEKGQIWETREYAGLRRLAHSLPYDNQSLQLLTLALVVVRWIQNDCIQHLFTWNVGCAWQRSCFVSNVAARMTLIGHVNHRYVHLFSAAEHTAYALICLSWWSRRLRWSRRTGWSTRGGVRGVEGRWKWNAFVVRTKAVYVGIHVSRAPQFIPHQISLLPAH